MSLLGFDALGRLALGQISGNVSTTTILLVSPGSFALTANAVTFKTTEPVNVAAFGLTGVSTSFKISSAPAAATFALTGVAASFRISAVALTGSYVLSGVPTTELITEPIASAAFTLTFLDVPVSRTGGDFDLTYGGIGHYLVEVENAKQLARITRKTPRPIDRTTKPQFAPIGSPPSAPPAPVIDLQAAQNERMAAQQQAAAQAATIKRRREEESILLLAC